MLICTGNPGKVAEFAGLLCPLGIDLRPITHLDIPETGETFEDNSLEKAMGYASNYPREWILAEDSGLVIPALNNLPGYLSARFSDVVLDDNLKVISVESSGRSRKEIDALNNHRVLQMMRDLSPSSRGAHFISCVTLLRPGGDLAFQISRKAHGWIVNSPRGQNGFGYDPIFCSEESFGLTWAELDPARKELISHRSKAIHDFMSWICSSQEDIK